MINLNNTRRIAIIQKLVAVHNVAKDQLLNEERFVTKHQRQARAERFYETQGYLDSIRSTSRGIIRDSLLRDAHAWLQTLPYQVW